MTMRAFVARVGRRRARTIAAVLIAYGATGALLLAVVGLTIAPAIAGMETLAGSARDVRSALATTRDAFDGFRVSVVEGRRSAERAAVTARSTAGTARQLSDSMSVSIFGAQPLLPIASGFVRQSQDLDALAAELDLLATSLGRNEGDVRALREEVAALHARAASLAAVPLGSGPIAPVAYALIAWLAVQAVAAVAAGLAIWRRAR
ncbi:MAG TPA: hypothetical protein VFM93_09185 [Candidatus Limnocylindria bacterium]|nr:hypothetical protein [Candidatus Limnocylindria bacterium]